MGAAKILVVDDNPLVLRLYTSLLQAEGYEVVQAPDGAACRQTLRAERPDLVLLDVVLPDVNGKDLCREIKANPEFSGVFVVLITSYEKSSEEQAAGLDAGADGYLVRPLNNRELMARVQSMVRIQQTESALRQAKEELEARVRERTAELSRTNRTLEVEVAERRRSEETIRRYARELVEARESERRYIARELHDEIGQMLTGLKMSLQMMAEQIPAPFQAKTQEISGLVDELMSQVRQLSGNLRPQILDDLGLLPALRWFFQRYTQQTGIQVYFKHNAFAGRLAPMIETAVFRIVQEALTNVARHAAVKEAVVRLWVDEEVSRVQIEDKGAGFQVENALQARNSSGLSNMRERAQLLEGECVIESVPGQGTCVTFEMPLTPAAPEPISPS